MQAQTQTNTSITEEHRDELTGIETAVESSDEVQSGWIKQSYVIAGTKSCTITQQRGNPLSTLVQLYAR